MSGPHPVAVLGGTGYVAGRGSELLEGMALPNLEDPNDLISGWKDRPAPAGFGFVGRLDLLLKLGDHAIGQFTRALQVAFPLGLVQFGPRPVKLLFQIARAFKLVTLRLPLGRHLG